MGDRGNIEVLMPGTQGTVVLYTHWGGSELPVTLQTALRRGRARWNDPQYLTRIIFCTMLEGNLDDLTGYGITTQVYDNEYPILVVDPQKAQVRMRPELSQELTASDLSTQPAWSFEEYCALPNMGWEAIADIHD